MTMRVLMLAMAWTAAMACFAAGELTAETFYTQGELPAGSLVAPTSLAWDGERGLLYVADGGAGRVTAMGGDGRVAEKWSPPNGVALSGKRVVVVASGVYLMEEGLTRGLQHRVHVTTVRGEERAATVNLPTAGATTLDAAGRVIGAYMRAAEGGGDEVVVVRAGEARALTELGAAAVTPAATVTGIALSAGGQLAVGLAGYGDARYGATRSWLLRGRAEGSDEEGWHTDLRVAEEARLLDGQGNVNDRYRVATSLAGTNGYPAKPCVPLYADLMWVGERALVSRGSDADPFLRVYGVDGAPVRSMTRRAAVAGGVVGESERLFALAAGSSRIEVLGLDGRTLGTIEGAPAVDLTRIVSLAAEAGAVYVATQREDGYHLARFTAGGEYCWDRTVSAPTEMPGAAPVLCAPAAEGVYAGWRMPGARGVGWVGMVTSDGLAGKPLWQAAYAGVTAGGAPCPTPLSVALNGRMHVVREMPKGVQTLSFSTTGAYLRSLPADADGAIMASAVGTIAALRADDGGTLVAYTYDALGKSQGWKSTHRKGSSADLTPVPADANRAWLAGKESLLRFDDTFTVVEECAVRLKDGARLRGVVAAAGDGTGTVYLATPGAIYAVRVAAPN